MRGHGRKSACIIISVFILLILLLLPGISHAVRYGHIKQVTEPGLPEIKCGEPGDEPLMSTRTLSHSNYDDGAEINDSRFNKFTFWKFALDFYYRSTVLRSCAF
jgi:hypothetical protein